MAQKPLTVFTYAAAASFAAAVLVYLLAPSFHSDDSSIDFLTRKRKSVATGLVNPANDCFINSVLQALAGIDHLRYFLAEKDDYDKSIRAESDATSSAPNGDCEKRGSEPTKSQRRGPRDVPKDLKIMLDELNKVCDYKRNISARPFIRTLEDSIGQRLNRNQQDAQEFLQIILERLDSENVVGSNGCKNMQRAQYPAKSQSFPFYGETKALIECQTCHFSPNRRPDPMVMLHLTVLQRATTSLDDCLDLHFKREIVSDYHCAMCHKTDLFGQYKRRLSKAVNEMDKARIEEMIRRIEHAISKAPEATIGDLSSLEDCSTPSTKIYRSLRITSFPPVLTIHLSRSMHDFGGTSLKNTAKVAFQEDLLIGGLLDRRHYRLQAMIAHKGSHSSGHYEAFRRQGPQPLEPVQYPEQTGDLALIGSCSDSHGHEDAFSEKRSTPPALLNRRDHGRRRRRKHDSNRWWRISDDQVRECTTADVLAMHKDVYLLFYETVESG